MSDDSSPFIILIVVVAFATIGGMWGADILYAIVPALIIAPLASLFYLKFDLKKIGKVLLQIGINIMISGIMSIIVALGSLFFHNEFDTTSYATKCIAFILTLGIGGAISVFVTKQSIAADQEAEERDKREIESKKQAIEKERELEEKFGKCEQKIPNPRSLGKDYLVRVFFQTKTVILKRSDVFSFSDIVRCHIEKRKEPGYTVVTTKTNVIDNKSVIERSVVGALVAGETGAIIGGLTANTIEKEQSNFVPCSINKYKVFIYTKKQDRPLITIDTYENYHLAENIKNTIDAIIAMA